MRKTITMYELLNAIKKYKERVESIYKDYIDSETQISRMMVSVYNPITEITINGVDVNKVEESIRKIDENICSTISTLTSLLLIRERENTDNKISVKSPFGNEEITMTISQALAIKSDKFIKYYIGYFDKLASDLSKGQLAIEMHHKSVLSEDKISRYVESKLQMLNMAPCGGSEFNDIKNSNLYKQFSDEYREINTFKLLDPLDIENSIIDRKNSILDFYDAIDTEIRKFNAIHTVEIDFNY